MTELIYLLCGIVLVLLIIPVLQSITDVLCGFGEFLKSILIVKITANSVKAEKLSTELEQPPSTSTIGFVSDEPIEYVIVENDDEEESEDDDELCDRIKQPIGFCDREKII